MPMLKNIGIVDDTTPTQKVLSCTIRDLIIEEIQKLKHSLSDVAINEATRLYHNHVKELKDLIKLSTLREEYLPTYFRDLLLDQYYSNPKKF